MSKRTITVVLRGVISLLILMTGLKISDMLIKSRKPAAQVDIPEQALRVDVISASFKDVSVNIYGLGEVRARDIVQVSPEIAGRIVGVHPKLETGGVIPAGEVLFEIDPRDFLARHEQSVASVSQLTNQIDRMEKQYANDKDRLVNFRRSSDLAEAELVRIKRLHERDKIATQSQVDNAEMAFNNANDSLAVLSQSVDLFPIRINEIRDSLASAEATARLTEANLERTKVAVNFDARVKDVSVEEGQYVTPGMSVLTLANDSILEISVSLDSKVASKWLEFDDADVTSNSAWFGELARVPVEVTWSDEAQWNASLHRIEKFDQDTRTINVVVRISARNALNPVKSNQPLVEGMFCKVTIPGKTARNVVELPIECVSFAKDDEGYRTVFLAKESPDDGKLRLASAKVRESHIAGESIFIIAGLSEGQQVVTTRLINPLSNSLLNTDNFEAAETD